MVKVFINPGHGGKDPGAVGNGLQEKEIVLQLGKKIVAMLKDYDVEVKLFRADDTYYSLDRICKEANDWKADLFISLHVNAGGGTGYEDYIYSGLKQSSQTAKLRDIFHAAVVKQLPEVRDRGKKQANFAVLRGTKMPAILTENLFIDNKTDAKRLKSETFLTKIATGHVHGIVQALSLKKKQAIQSKEKPKENSKSAAFYRVIAGSYHKRENAEQQIARLKKLGIDAFIDVVKQ